MHDMQAAQPRRAAASSEQRPTGTRSSAIHARVGIRGAMGVPADELPSEIPGSAVDGSIHHERVSANRKKMRSNEKIISDLYRKLEESQAGLHHVAVLKNPDELEDAAIRHAERLDRKSSLRF